MVPRFLHRELIQIAVLALVAIAAFFVTRSVAANNRAMALRDAAEWYRRGQQGLAQGRVDDAIESFRRAAVKNRGDRTYTRALAQALERKGDAAAATSALLALRETDPEDAEVNLELARLAAARQDRADAIRYYHNALYAPWAPEAAAARRQVRVELVKFLLAQNETSRAVSELIALSSDLPDEAAARVEVGRLLLQAGDARHAADQFARALRTDPRDVDALAGAGEAAFRLGDYESARAYLRTVAAGRAEVDELREIASLVLSRDPLANRVASGERRRRLEADLAHATDRLRDCVAPAAPQDAAALQQESEAFAARLETPEGRDVETIDAGVDLIDRIERAAAIRCPPKPMDRALLIIARRHGSDER